MAVVTGMIFNTDAVFLGFDIKRWTVEQRKAILQAMKKAAVQWMKQIAQRVPKDTGFLRSGFENLGAAIGYHLTDSGMKRGRNLYGQEEKLDSLVKRKEKLKNQLLAKGFIKQEGKKRFKRNIGQHRTVKQIRKDVKKYKKEKKNEKEKKFSQQSAKEANIHKEQGLSIHSNLESTDRKSKAIYKREKNVEFYKEQHERRMADKAIGRFKDLLSKIREQRIAVGRALEREPALKMKAHANYHKWETTEVEKVHYANKEVEKPNPAYPTNAMQLIKMKKAGTLPAKTIKVVERVAVITKKMVRRPVPLLSNKNLVDIYRKYYYPKRGVRGPLKTPAAGMRYGTPVENIFTMEVDDQKAQIGQDLSTVNNQGKESQGTKGAPSGGVAYMNFTPQKSLDMAHSELNSPKKITFNFTYGVDINYWRIMDLFGSYMRKGKMVKANGTPWKALFFANQAFKTSLQNELRNAVLPFSDYIVTSRGTLRGTSFSKGV